MRAPASTGYTDLGEEGGKEGFAENMLLELRGRGWLLGARLGG